MGEDEKLLWNTLEGARRLLWRLLVEHERGELTLPDRWKLEVDTMERVCSDVLKYCEGEEEGG